MLVNISSTKKRIFIKETFEGKTNSFQPRGFGVIDSGTMVGAPNTFAVKGSGPQGAVGAMFTRGIAVAPFGGYGADGDKYMVYDGEFEGNPGGAQQFTATSGGPQSASGALYAPTVYFAPFSGFGANGDAYMTYDGKVTNNTFNVTAGGPQSASGALYARGITFAPFTGAGANNDKYDTYDGKVTNNSFNVTAGGPQSASGAFHATSIFAAPFVGKGK